MKSLLENRHFKDNSPEYTVKYLKNILSAYGVEVEEHWNKVSSIGTYSLRVNFKGTNVGSNGKGVSKEFAQASAYAELFERYQNEILISNITEIENPYKFKISADEKFLYVEELIKQDDAFINQYFYKRSINDKSIEEKEYAFRNAQLPDDETNGKFICVPFYSFQKNKVVYLPKKAYATCYGSNGMCAGNTREEALVQGLSEIIERYVQKRMMREKTCFPNVPDEYLETIPEIYCMYKKINQSGEYYCKVKDCYYGGKYPVAALLVVKRDTGEYGIRFGCHPDFGIAIERTFTESTQGQDIGEFCKSSLFDFTNFNVDSWDNITNAFKVGIGQYPYQIFSDNSSYSFTPVKSVSKMSNKEILDRWIKDLMLDGYDVMIRNVSFLGFPTFHIIIPGISELLEANDTMYRARNTRKYATFLLHNISNIKDKEDYRYIIASLDFFSNSIMDNVLMSYFPEYESVHLPYQKYGCDCLYLSALCSFCLGEYDKALKKIASILKIVENSSDKNFYKQTILRAEKYYFQGMMVLNNHDVVMGYMQQLFSEHICQEITSYFKNTDKLIEKKYSLVLKQINANDSSKKYLIKYVNILREQQLKNPIDQLELSSCIK